MENIKFSKNFKCETNKCIIKSIPPFSYNLRFYSNGFEDIIKKIDLSKQNKINITFDKKITIKKLDNKDISKREEILSNIKKKLVFAWKKINYKNIFWEDDYVFFQKNNKLNFYNLKDNSSFDIIFKPNINYIKKSWENTYIINTNVWSFLFNILNKKLEYFSLFWDFIIVWDNYIWIINNDDEIRKKNFDLEDKNWNFIILYNKLTKNKKIIYTFDNKIIKVYKKENKIFIEDEKSNKFEINWI